MKNSWRMPFIAMLACLLVCLALLAYPVYVIQPFRRQGATELAVALQVIRIRPAVVVVLAALAALFTFITWNRLTRLLPRLGIAVLGAATIVTAALSFVNIYELMFHPLRLPTFQSVSRTHLGDTEQVIAVKLHGSARAYPIRVISYHHIVNDVVAGLPIVATY